MSDTSVSPVARIQMVVEISEEGQQRVNIGKRDTTGYL